MKGVIFDLDGTIADSTETIYEIFQALFADFGFPTPSRRSIRKVEAFDRARIIWELLPPEKKGDKELKGRMDERCSVLAHEAFARIKPMKGAKELLRFLKRKKVKVAIATNRGNTAPELLRALGLAGYFDAMVTARHVKNPKPHPEPLLLALREIGVRGNDALFVGDNGVDLQAGRAAGIKTVLLTKRGSGIGKLRIRSLLGLKPLLGIGK